MHDKFYETLALNEGSTEPGFPQAQIQLEAAKIRELWKTRDWQSQGRQGVDSKCWYRHKSLVLNLALEEYSLASQESTLSIPLNDYCQRYTGLGRALEKSIFRQLEVKKCLDEHSILLDIDKQFSWPTAGDTFQNFRVLEELGRGALARVYLCEQLHLGGRSAVVKIELGESIHEPSLLGKLRHPNIVAVHWADYDPTAGASYLCMPFHGRSTLVDLLSLAFHEGLPADAKIIKQAGNLWLKDSDQYLIDPVGINQHTSRSSSYIDAIIRLVLQIADALAYAHNQHVIHGDIKPSNVLLSPEGIPLLFDFNLGRAKGTLDGPAGGTLAYMAPEQLHFLAGRTPGEYPTSEIATDIYAFGALCYELLAGKPPFEIPAELTVKEEIAQTLIALQRCGCQNLHAHNPQVDEQLAELLASCLAFAPEKRPISMKLVCDQLAHHVGRLAAGRRYAKNHPLRTAMWGLATLGIVAASGTAHLLRPTLLEKAAAAQEAGNYQQAVVFLDQVLEDEPLLKSARFDRARWNLELADYQAAYQDLSQLVQTTEDATIMAYYGYCLNLMGKHDAAIEWHRRALDSGFVTPGILNNLGVSLMLHSDQISLRKHLGEASTAFQQAQLKSSNSFVIRMNALRNAIQQLENNLEVNVDQAIENSLWLREKSPESASVWKSTFTLYDLLADNLLIDRREAFACLQKIIELKAYISTKQLKDDPMYKEYRKLPGYVALLKAALTESELSSSGKVVPQIHLLDPVMTD